MRRFVPHLLMIVLAIAGLCLALEVATFDVPVYTGRLMVNAMDPSHPGHMKTVVVSGSELLAKTLLVVACMTYAVSVWQWTRRAQKQ